MFGMLTQVEEGKLHLEDEDAHIELIMLEAVSCEWCCGSELSNWRVLVGLWIWIIYRWCVCVGGGNIQRSQILRQGDPFTASRTSRDDRVGWARMGCIDEKTNTLFQCAIQSCRLYGLAKAACGRGNVTRQSVVTAISKLTRRAGGL